MPPWKAVPGFGKKFQHDRSLRHRRHHDPGPPGPRPMHRSVIRPTSHRPCHSPTDWCTGTPDLVLEIPESYSIPATGGDIYRCFVLPTSLPKDVYISAIEYRPDNRRVVHHMLGWVDITGEARKKDAGDPGPGYSCFSGPEVQIPR